MERTLRYLYIFPHPDDESFGPAGAINQQVRAGHEVHLLTLTRGGATQARHKLGLGVEEMGAVRFNEMQDVKRVLKLKSLTILDHPDSGLKELDPRLLEKVVEDHMLKIKPNIVVTYPVHGGSGFHDHLVTHAVVNRVFLKLRDNGHGHLKRLAYFTMPDKGAPSILPDGWPRLKLTETELIDCIVPLSAEDVDAMKQALLSYTTYQETVQKMGVIEKIGDKVHFEIAYENFAPPLGDLAHSLN